MPDFDPAVYNPPGVYVQEDTSSVLAALGLNPTVIALVGPSIGYRTYTEAVTLNSTTNVRLTKLGVDTSSVVVLNSDSGLDYEATTDYLLTEGAGADADIDTTYDNTVDLKRVGGGAIADGETVLVSYHYTDASYYDPVFLQDFDTVQDYFGAPFNSQGTIQSPLSLAAKIAIDNGGARMWLVATDNPVTRASLATAYTKIQQHPEINIVVPIPAGISGTDQDSTVVDGIMYDLKTFLEELATREKAFAVGLLGFDTGVTRDPLLAVSNNPSKRVALHYPNMLNYYNGMTNTTLTIGGFYAMAGYAGRINRYGPEEALTRKQLFSFSGIPSAVIAAMTASRKNAMSSGGVFVTERTRDGKLVCRHGVTTDVSNIHKREISLVRTRDALVDQLQRTFDQQGVIGSPITAETPAALKALAMGVLESAIQSHIIFNYQDLKVRQRPDDPTIMEVKFMYRPTYPLNYVLILFQVNTTTGDFTLTA